MDGCCYLYIICFDALRKATITDLNNVLSSNLTQFQTQRNLKDFMLVHSTSSLFSFFRDLTGNKIQDISEEALRKYPHLKTL